MAQLMNVKLSRFDSTPWGFRLQGGKDFGSPLVIQKVNGGSPAEKAGLQAGDAVIKVNEMEVFNLRHKEAQDNIVRAGNNFEFTIQRGGSTWKPLVAPVGAVPTAASPNIQPVTKTSLAAKKHDYTPVGSAHNFAPKPFSPQVNGDATIKSIVSKQYNTPVAIYSEETIAETLSAQAEVLAGGVLGVNFKKNERNYNAANSEVFKMVHEIDNEPRTPEPEPSHYAAAAPVAPSPMVGLRHVTAPEVRPAPTTNPHEPLPPGQNICADCERLIVGVFVRIKDKNLHVECFKCATCGTSLKNVGYYNIHNKLYCDIHAKLVARQNPPAPNLEPVTVPPGGRVPAGTISAAINAAAAASAPLSAAPSLPPLNAGNMSPQPAALGPMPFHTPSAVSAPKPFNAPSAPSATLPRPVSVNSKFVWPPTRAEEDMSNTPTATPLYIAPTPLAQPPVQPQVQRAPVRQPPVQPPPVQQPPVQQPPIQRPQPLQPKKQQTLQTVPGSPSVYPQPYSDFLQHQPVQRPSSSLGQPLTFPLAAESNPRPRSAFSPPTSKVPGANPKATPLIPVPGKMCPQGQLPQPCNAETNVVDSRAEVCQSPMIAALTIAPERPYSPLPSAAHGVNVGQLVNKPQAPICPVTQPQFDKTEESLPKMDSEAFHKKMSICSQEISSINDRKALSSKIEALSESLDTQMMVSSMSEALEFDRPASPTPSKDTSPPVPRNSLVPDTAMFEAACASKVIKPVQEEPCIKAVANESKPVTAKVVTFEPPGQFTSIQPMQFKETTRTVVEEASRQTTQVSQTKSTVKQQEITTARRQSGGLSEMKSSLMKQESSSMFQQSSSSFSTVKSVMKQESGSMSMISDSNPTPALERSSGAPQQSLLVSALTTAPTRPYSPLPSATTAPTSITDTPATSSMPYKQVPQQQSSGFKPIAQTQQSLEETSQKSSTTTLLSALTIAPDRPYSPLPSTVQSVNPIPLPKQPLPYQPKADVVAPREEVCQSPMISALTIAPERPYSPLPIAAQGVKPIQLPKQPLPYQPKADAVVPRPEACQSPMISALTIAPERSYSPLPGATKPQETVPTQTPPQIQPHQTQAPLLPISSERISMLSALTIAPDSPYSLLSSTTQSSFSATTQSVKKQETSAFKTVPLRTIQQPSAVPAFTPTVAPSKPAPAYVLLPVSGLDDQIERSSFHPISAELKNTYSTTQPPRPATPVKQIPTTTEVQQPSSLQAVKPTGLPVATPARSRSATPSQPKRPGSSTGLQKPATIPYYQQQMLEYPFQPPRSATPISCPMITEPTSAQTLTPQDASTIPNLRSPSPSPRNWRQDSAPQPPDTVAQLPKRPVTPIQTPPRAFPQAALKPVAPQPLQKSVVLQQAQNVAQQPLKPSGPLPLPLPQPKPPVSTQQTPGKLLPFPNIPLPQGTGTKLPTNQANIPAFKPIPMDLPTPKFAPQSTAAPLASSFETKIPVPPNASTVPSAGGAAPGGGGKKGAAFAGATAPRRGRGVLNHPNSLPAGARIPLCGHCNGNIRGPFITALGKIWCPEHFVCVNEQCRRQLADIGFVEEQGGLYCEYCFEKYLAPACDKCNSKIKGDCVNAIGKHYHPECFVCAYCSKLFGNNPFFLEDGLPYCETDWNELFTTKCFACGFPIEAGDRWVEALSNNYHSQCFNCTSCKKNLEGQSFFAKGGRPFCKTHAR